MAASRQTGVPTTLENVTTAGTHGLSELSSAAQQASRSVMAQHLPRRNRAHASGGGRGVGSVNTRCASVRKAVGGWSGRERGAPGALVAARQLACRERKRVWRLRRVKARASRAARGATRRRGATQLEPVALPCNDAHLVQGKGEGWSWVGRGVGCPRKTLTLAAIAPLAASVGHVDHGDRVVTELVTSATEVGLVQGSDAQESVPTASLGSRKETAPGEGDSEGEGGEGRARW